MGLSIQTTTYKVIYVYQHEGITDALKIGKTSIEAPSPEGLTPNCKKLNDVAKQCIKTQTQRAGVDFKLLHTELGWFPSKEGVGQSFDDHVVHEVLRNNGYKQKKFDSDVINPQEWYEVDLETVIKAIAAIKSEDFNMHKGANKSKEPILFRKEQQAAIDNTVVHFETGQKMLWNAKMRFGKTLCALDLIRRQNYKRTLILTHRPAVRSGWFEDYHKIDFVNYLYGSKEGVVTNPCNTYVDKDGKPECDQKGKDFATLEKELSEHETHYIYFASMQDLRGSKNVSDKGIDKNDEVFKTDWDLIILDEAHEGTETPLGQNVINELCENHTPKLLYLSGTPFNILYHFSDDKGEIYTWDYVMEQDAKERWQDEHPGEPNPYEGLARLNIYTYNLGEVFERNDYVRSDDDYFNFAEFFRVWKGNEKQDGAPMPSEGLEGKFVHEEDVWKFLSLLCDPASDSMYPFTTEEFCNSLNHTLWMLPGVDAAKALDNLINRHPLHTEHNFTVINVAGEGSKIEGLDEDDAKRVEKLGNDMLAKVKDMVNVRPRTITLSCGRLTTGVSVPEWTGVFMLRGGADVDAGNYMQTIFRGQTPYKNGAIKSNCYAFDFSPDRTLTVVYDYVKKQPSKNRGSKGERVASLLRFCPVIAMQGGNEDAMDAVNLMDRVHEAYKLHYQRHGLKGSKYTKNWNIKGFELFEQIGKLFNKEKVGVTRDGKIDLSQSGLTHENGGKKGKGKKKTPATPKPKKKKDEETRKDKAQNVANQILTRLPLMLFGAVTDASHLSFKELMDDNVIDPESWGIFMPEGFTKQMFAQAAEYLEEEGIIVIADSIIKTAQKADSMPVEKRVKEIASMLHVFHFPDHETVLTPWRVVNMHMGDTLGGYNFFDESYRNSILLPRWVEAKDGVSEKVFKTEDTQILEINSKSGVYPLYLAYTLWRVKCEKTHPVSETEKRKIWDEVLSNHIFVLCQTSMAKKITERVLRGYRDSVVTHCMVYPNLVEILRAPDNAKNRKKKENLIKDLKKTSYWNINNGKKQMKFSAVVSNPPYQSGKSKDPLYHHFVELAKGIDSDFISMIMPAKWYDSGKNLDKFRQTMLNDTQLKILIDFENFSDCFQGVDIAGGVCYFLRDKSYTGLCEVTTVNGINRQTLLRDLSQSSTFVRNVDSDQIRIMIENQVTDFFNTKVSSQKPFGLRTYVVPTEEGELTLRYNQGKGPFKRDLVLSKSEWIDKWKVITSYRTNEHAGQTDRDGRKRILSTTEILAPSEICTETYIVVNAVDTEEEAQNILKYLKTRFVRFLISIRTSTQTLSKKNFDKVPLQDFTHDSDIDWTQPIENIDQQLYAKYGLHDYIEFIENTVRPMD